MNHFIPFFISKSEHERSEQSSAIYSPPHTQSRRALFSTSALAVLALAGCATAPTPPTRTQLQTDALLVAPVLDIVVPALLAKPSISATDTDAINKAAAGIKDAARLIATNSGVAAVNAQFLVDAINALAPAAIKYLAKDDPYRAGLMQAAVDMTDVILSAGGVAVPSVPAGKAERARMVLGRAR